MVREPRVCTSKKPLDAFFLTNRTAAEIFASGDNSDKVATDWYHRFTNEEVGAITDLVNCILLSAGCDQLVTEDDIQDPENISNRLADLQNVYTEVETPLLFKYAAVLVSSALTFPPGGHYRLSSHV